MKKLNKKNILEFADYLYKEITNKNGETYIHFVPLCRSSIAELNNNEVTCCVLGEMYAFFTGEMPYTISKNSLDLYPIATSKAVEKIINNRLSFYHDIYSLSFTNDSYYDLIKRAKMCSQECKNIANKYFS